MTVTPADPRAAVSSLLRGIAEFEARIPPGTAAAFAELAAGQHPGTLFITCADSRVVPNLITGTGPGDLFTVRTVGNLVPTWDVARRAPGGDAVASAVEYAVQVLGVPTIAICGHTGCGAMRALADGPLGDDPVSAWLANGAPAQHRLPPPGTADLPAADRLAMANVAEQLEHLQGYPSVAAAVAAGRLELVGLLFDIGGARTLVRDAVTGAFESPAGAGLSAG